MNVFIVLFYFMYDISCLITVTSERSGLTALNDSYHTVQLYLELKNENAPSEGDPAQDKQFQRQFCEDIISSGFLPSIYTQSHIEDLIQERYVAIFRDVYHPTYLENGYTNSFKRREFNSAGDGYLFYEHTFACLFKNSTNSETYGFYVSKEYNVGPSGSSYKPGRFIFAAQITGSDHHVYENIILAEEPAVAYSYVGFNIERLYLRMRKYIQPTDSNKTDPLCKLISEDISVVTNQHNRFCVGLLRSSNFKEEIVYPSGYADDFYPCYNNKISFRSLEAIQEAGDKTFYERMTPCRAVHTDPSKSEIFLYISRAYLSNAVFVFSSASLNGKIYLENLNINVSILDEINSFDHVEY